MDKAAAARIQSAGARSKGHDTQAGSWEAKAQVYPVHHACVRNICCRTLIIHMTSLLALRARRVTRAGSKQEWNPLTAGVCMHTIWYKGTKYVFIYVCMTSDALVAVRHAHTYSLYI